MSHHTNYDHFLLQQVKRKQMLSKGMKSKAEQSDDHHYQNEHIEEKETYTHRHTRTYHIIA